MLTLDRSTNQSPWQKDPKAQQKLQLNYRRAKQTDRSPELDELAAKFNYEDCRDDYWNPGEFSLLYGTPLWEQASESQRIVLNQIGWLTTAKLFQQKLPQFFLIKPVLLDFIP